MAERALSAAEYRDLEAERKKRRRRRPREPEVGIWWDDGKKLVVLSNPVSTAERTSRWLNGSWDHWRAWPAIASVYDRTDEDEYCSVPRGRVVYDVKNQLPVIYHGTATTPGRLKRIAAQFNLESWQASLDEHYESSVPDHEFDID